MEAFQGHPDQQFGHVSYAQHGDDFMVLNLFRLIGIDRARYLDIGAHHPTIISNTRKLYERGWRGVNVEANPHLIDAFLRERPDDTTVHVGVAAGASNLEPFYLYSDTSGRNTFSVNEVASLQGILKVQSQVLVPTVTIAEIVERYCGGRYPEFLTMDIEGLDFEVLQGAKFVETPYVICVETRRDDTEGMRAMMRSKGYFCYCRMGENLFFVSGFFRDAVY